MPIRLRGRLIDAVTVSGRTRSLRSNGGPWAPAPTNVRRFFNEVVVLIVHSEVAGLKIRLFAYRGSYLSGDGTSKLHVDHM